MARRRKDAAGLVAELFEKVGPHYYDRVDIEMSPQEQARVESRLSDLKPDQIAGLRVTGIDSTDGLRLKLEDGAWALFRLSGTEPLMRIYTEVPREELVPVVLAQCRKLAGV
jgi:phosphomannomutase